MAEVILHIGLPKTGSSAIQLCLSTNHKTLAARGIRYPGVRGKKALGNREISSGNGVQLARALAEPSRDFAMSEAKWQTVATNIAARLCSDDSDVLLSSEFLSYFDLTRFEFFRKQVNERGKSVRIICYVRHVADLLLSRYNQAVKRAACAQPFTAYLSRGLAGQCRDLEQVLGKLEAVRSSCVVDVRLYDSLDGTLLEDFFLGALKLSDTRDFQFDDVTVNRSLNASEVLFMRRLNAACQDKRVSKKASDMLIARAPELAIERSITEEELALIQTKATEVMARANRLLTPPKEMSLKSQDVRVGSGRAKGEEADRHLYTVLGQMLLADIERSKTTTQSNDGERETKTFLGRIKNRLRRWGALTKSQ